MTLVGGGQTGGVGGVETASSPSSSGGGGGGGTATAFDVPLSYGHGMDVDAQLPAVSFWLTETTVADLARSGQTREWPVDQDLITVGLDVDVSLSSGLGEGLPLIVTVDGVDTTITLSIPDGIVADTVFSASATLAVASGSTIGVRVDATTVGVSAQLRLQARLHGAASSGGGGLTSVTHDSTLTGAGTVASPLSTAIKSISGTHGVLVTSDGAGNYTARGGLPGQPGGSSVGTSHNGGGLISLDIAGVGTELDSARQLIGVHLNALTLSDSGQFDWSGVSAFYKTAGFIPVISDAWIVVRQFSGGLVSVAPEVTLYIDTSTSPIQISSPFSPSASDINNSGLPVPFTIPIRTSFLCSEPIDYIVSGTPGNGPGLTAKITRAATGPTLLDIVVMVAIELDILVALNP